MYLGYLENKVKNLLKEGKSLPNGIEYTIKMLKTDPSRVKSVKYANGGGVGRSSTAKAFDKKYKAIGAGERTSKKFATISMTDGTKFKRRNANQYGEAQGGLDYTEKRVNRTDKYSKDGKVIAQDGAFIETNRVSFVYEIGGL
jgi:hypothetical protein